MTQATANPTTTLSRRSLAGILAGLMVPANAGAADRRDPIFRAIARHKLAEDDLEGAIVRADLNGKGVDSHHPAQRRVNAAAIALLTVPPSTPGGLAALLWYVRNNEEQGNSLGCGVFLRDVQRAAAAAFNEARVV